MTTVEILETRNGRRFLHVHSGQRATTLVPINDEQMQELKDTIRDPTPIQHRGKHEFEIVEGGGDEMFIFIELENNMSTLVPLDETKDLVRLEQTIAEPYPFNGRKSSVSRS